MLCHPFKIEYFIRVNRCTGTKRCDEWYIREKMHIESCTTIIYKMLKIKCTLAKDLMEFGMPRWGHRTQQQNQEKTNEKTQFSTWKEKMNWKFVFFFFQTNFHFNISSIQQCYLIKPYTFSFSSSTSIWYTFELIYCCHQVHFERKWKKTTKISQLERRKIKKQKKNKKPELHWKPTLYTLLKTSCESVRRWR